VMGAALLGGTLASIPGLAWAKPKPEDAKCQRNKQCASGECVDSRCAPAVTPNFIDCDCGGSVIRGIGCATVDCSMADAFCSMICQDVGGGVSISCVPNPSFC